ncbi:hypothetical protein LTR37_015134 [Vermiconidia calcicola]|uniref:Uncharacterized protein n=1 Tax=Vermiconidia calcicola TaxID=1690605 RepID=A0ACC3MSM2_9PEZI|nr:hypothetical protein LTR37_015134 [Vermiconidia calcicola]
MELERFVKGRRLTLTIMSRKAFIAALQDADDALTFPHFLDLPAELRSEVYNHYLATFPGISHASRPPLLCKTSKLIRSEILPLSLRRLTYGLNLCIPHFRPDPRCSRPTRLAADFLATLPVKHIAEIRRLSVRINYGSVCTALITLSDDASRHTLEVKGSIGPKGSIAVGHEEEVKEEERMARRNELKARIGCVLEEVCTRAEKGFIVEDIYRIRKTLEDMYRQVIVSNDVEASANLSQPHPPGVA